MYLFQSLHGLLASRGSRLFTVSSSSWQCHTDATVGAALMQQCNALKLDPIHGSPVTNSNRRTKVVPGDAVGAGTVSAKETSVGGETLTRVAVAVWNGRVAPMFDVSRPVLVVDVTCSGHETCDE
jgi:hypothetical protein